MRSKRDYIAHLQQCMSDFFEENYEEGEDRCFFTPFQQANFDSDFNCYYEYLVNTQGEWLLFHDIKNKQLRNLWDEAYDWFCNEVRMEKYFE